MALDMYEKILNLEELSDYLMRQSLRLGGVESNPELNFKKFYTQFDVYTNNSILNKFPSIYSRVANSWNLLDIQVGYFAVSPIGYGVSTIAECLIRAQTTESFIPRSTLDKYDFYWVGSSGDFTFYVAGKDSCFPEDEVWAIDERILQDLEGGDLEYMYPLAPNFELFLLGAGNLNLTHRKIKNDEALFEIHKKEFLETLSMIGVGEKYHSGWLLFL